MGTPGCPTPIEEIVDGIAADVAERGYCGIKVNTLLKACGVGRKTFYEAFPEGKRHAFRHMLIVAQQMVEDVLSNAETPEDAIKSLLALVSERRHMAKAFLVDGPYETDIYATACERFAEMCELPRPRADAVVGGIAWITRRQLQGGGAIDESFARDLLAFAAPYIRESR